MLSLTDIEQIAKDYRFKFDMDSKQYSLIETKTSNLVTDEKLAVKVKVGLLLFQILKRKSNVVGNFSDEEFIKELQTQILNLIKTNQYNFTTAFNLSKTPLNELITAHNSDSIAPIYKTAYNDLFEYVANGANLTITDLKIFTKPNGVEHGVDVESKQLEVQKEQTVNEPRNRLPKTEKQIQNRLNFVDSLIEVFWETASDKHKMLAKRDQNKFVAMVKQHIKNGEPIPVIPSEKILIGILNALKANDEEFYLNGFLNDAIVNDMLIKMRKENYIQQMKDEAKLNNKESAEQNDKTVSEEFNLFEIFQHGV